MFDLKFDHIVLSETSIHWSFLKEEDRIPQIFRGCFMSHQLDSNTICNEHDTFLGPLKYGITASLSAGNLIGRKIASRKDLSDQGRWC